jgi:hypothetical protein
MELQFIIAIDTDFDTIFSTLQEIYKFNYTKKHEFVIGKNNVEIEENEDFNPDLVDTDDGYLYYRYNVNVYPIAEDISLLEQIDLSKQMRESFIKKGIKADILAAFEDML